jgi:hypothetical protein
MKYTLYTRVLEILRNFCFDVNLLQIQVCYCRYYYIVYYNNSHTTDITYVIYIT